MTQSMGFKYQAGRVNNLSGRSERIRTSDPCLPKAVHYRAVLHSDVAAIVFISREFPKLNEAEFIITYAEVL